MLTMTARTPAGRTERHGESPIPSPRRPIPMNLRAHDIASGLPAAIQGIVQKGLMVRAFKDSLHPEWIFPAICDTEPWLGNVGDQKIWTRTGLMAPTPLPVTPGADATAATYSIEQWTSTLDKYGRSIDTDMLASAVALGNKYLQDVTTLGIHAGQSMNQAARNALYYPYAGGRAYVTAGSSGTTLAVSNVTGFGYTSVNGVLTGVSSSNPLTVSINGTANTVTGITTTPGTLAGTLTLGASATATVGQAVVAANAPKVIQPTGTTEFDLSSSNVATLSLFRAAYTRLKKMNVPTINGGYTAFVTEDTLNELFSDPDFKQALTGRVDSPLWTDRSIGRIGGIDFVSNNEVPVLATGGSGQNMTVQQNIVVGAGACVWSPLAGLGDLLNGTGVENVPSIDMVSPAPGVEVALIVRPPQDRFQNQISTTWQTVGGFGVPTDLLNAAADAALYKRAVIVRNA